VYFLLNRDKVKVREEAFYGAGSGPILLDDLMCVGNETDLTTCRDALNEAPNCRHNEDVGVECAGGAADMFLVHSYNYFILSRDC
jgi:hypothetical protein